ncbi:MAG: tetratricopeptide repeat protein [Acetobacteraceae bacterium]
MPSDCPASAEAGAVEPDIVTLLSTGLAHHQAGRLAAAETTYRLVLERAPGQPNALYLYGVLRLACGQAEAAELLLSRAAAARPNDAETCFAHANALCRSGRRDAAIQRYRALLARWPGHIGARINLSNALREVGDAEAALGEAETAAKAAVGASRAAAETTRGAALLLLQRTDEAIDAYRRAIAAEADHAAAHAGLAASLLAAERPAEALPAAECAALLAPELAEAEFLRAMALAGLKAGPAAIAGLQRTIARDPRHAKAHLNLGNLFAEEDRLAEAETHCRRAIALDPKLVEAHASLGYLLTAQGGRLKEAIAACEAALALKPEFVQAHWNEGIALLLAGDYARGWEKYEARKGYDRFARLYPDPEGPIWQGEALNGRTILVHAEQGLGDTIQFARYLPLLAARGAKVVLACDAMLVPLMAMQPAALMPELTAVIARGTASPGYDCWVNQMSLPYRFATRLETIPAPSQYLAWNARRAQRFAERLPAGLRMGLAWAGNPQHSNDRRRSMPCTALAALLETRGVSFVSLQVGPRARDAAELPGLIDLTPEIRDFADTAALIATLDLVITVDTSVAHCAAALGKETWVMLPHAPDWRWLTEREDSPWYPSVRLFRQPEPGAWEAVVANVAGRLRARTAGP